MRTTPPFACTEDPCAGPAGTGDHPSQGTTLGRRVPLQNCRLNAQSGESGAIHHMCSSSESVLTLQPRLNSPFFRLLYCPAQPTLRVCGVRSCTCRLCINSIFDADLLQSNRDWSRNRERMSVMTASDVPCRAYQWQPAPITLPPTTMMVPEKLMESQQP